MGIKICNDSKKDLTVDCKIEIGDEVRKLHDIIDAENSFGFVNFLTHQECQEVRDRPIPGNSRYTDTDTWYRYLYRYVSNILGIGIGSK